MAARGYVPLCRLGVDVFFVAQSEYSDFCELIEARNFIKRPLSRR